MIEPDRCSFIGAAAACIPRNTPVWFTATIRFHASSAVSVIVAQCRMPALFMSTSRCPWLVEHPRRPPLPLVGSVTSCSRNVPPIVGRGLLALLDEHVGDVDGRALVGEQTALRRALSARPARDQCHSVLELSHRILPGSARSIGS